LMVPTMTPLRMRASIAVEAALFAPLEQVSALSVLLTPETNASRSRLPSTQLGVTSP
jgi:hypothetical protein